MGTNPTLQYVYRRLWVLASIEEKVEELVKGTIEELGYALYDVQYAKEGKEYYLRIFIDKPEGIDLNDCETVSNSINPLLDEANYIQEQYFLEVSSPGIERILRKEKHLQDNLGNLIEVKLFQPFEKQKTIQGVLQDFNTETLTLERNGESLSIERKNIAIMKTVFNW